MKFINLLSLGSHFKDEPEEGSEMWVTNEMGHSSCGLVKIHS
jgi:hypothetical protein